MDNQAFGAIPRSAWDFPTEDTQTPTTTSTPPPESSPVPRNGATATGSSTPASATASGATSSDQHDDAQKPPRRRVTRKPKARQCRICTDETEPVLDEGAGGLLGSWLGSERQYVFPPDEELGRWICPCRCSGTVKWVHEGCLKEWRFQNARRDDFYQCYLCKSKYKFARMSWAQRVRSPLLSVCLTLVIFLLSVFLLGFIADPILSLWLDPAGTIVDGVSSVTGGPVEREIIFDDYEEEDWWDHWLKGFFSLGIVGIAKAFLLMSPWQWWNLRTTGLLGGTARRGTGRDRVENISIALVIFGAISFIYAVWKGVRLWTQKTLDKISNRVLSVQVEDSDDDFETIIEDEPETRKDQ